MDNSEAAIRHIENALDLPRDDIGERVRKLTERPKIIQHEDHVPQKPVEPEAVVAPLEKVDHTLLPIDALEEVSKVLMYGRIKFGAWNWAQHPLTYSQYVAKVYRHIMEFQKGNYIDPLSGGSHIACAIADLMFLQSHIIKGRSKDDRFKD
jgi:Domain of unknown function (DUF5664)